MTAAIELEDSCELRSNRAHVRIILGRKLRSMGFDSFVGYRRSAHSLLEQAVEGGIKAVDLNPAW